MQRLMILYGAVLVFIALFIAGCGLGGASQTLNIQASATTVLPGEHQLHRFSSRELECFRILRGQHHQ